MAIIWLFSLFSFVLSFEYSIFEYESAKHFLPDSFLSFGQSLNKTLNSAKGTIIKNSKDTSFAFVLDELELFKMTYKGYEDVLIRDNSLIYKVPKLLYFEMQSSYVITLGLLPITGQCRFAVDIEDMEFKLAFKEKEIIPSFTAKFNVTVSKLTNSIFNVRKRIESLIPYIIKYFSPISQKLFITTIKEYYEKLYADSSYYVTFRHLGGYTVGIKNRLKGFSLGENSYGKVTVVDYTQDVSKVNIQSIPDRNFTRCIKFQVEELTDIIKKELATVKDLKLTEDMILAESYFHLNLVSLSQIFPDLLYEDSKTTGILTFNCAPEIVGYFIEGKKRFDFTVPLVTLKITLNNEIQTQLIDLSLSVAGEFSLVFTQSGDNLHKVFMKLTANTVKATIREISNLWNNNYAIFNRRGLEAFIQNMLSQHFMKYYGRELLGTGLLISTGVPLGELNHIESAGGSHITVCFA